MRTVVGVVAFALLGQARAGDSLEHRIQGWLTEGRIPDAEQWLAVESLKTPNDDQVRLALGIVKALGAAERFAQTMHEYGPKQAPDLDPQSNVLWPSSMRRALDVAHRDLDAAERVLAEIRDPNVKFSLKLKGMKFDRRGDGKPVDDADRWVPFVNMHNPDLLKYNPEVRVVFDRADVSWLRGYCRLIQANLDFMLALDGRELFDLVAFAAFRVVRTSNPTQIKRDLDFAALLKAIERVPVKERHRLKRVRRFLLETCERSRETWRYIQAETDDDFELLPNPKQKGAFSVPVNREMIDVWLQAVGEVEGVLEGKKLLPLGWDRPAGKGFNACKFLEDPPAKVNFMSIVRADESKYMEVGEMTDGRVWNRAQQTFGGSMLGFAIWFN